MARAFSESIVFRVIVFWDIAFWSNVFRIISF